MTTKHFNMLKNSLEIYVCEMYSIQEKHSEEFECIFVQEKCILFKCILFKCILIKSALKNWNTFSKNPSYGCYRNVFWEKVVCTANDGEAQLKWISCQRLHSHCYSNYLFDIHHLPTYNNVKKNWNDENSTFD